jgi:hypothetical protein
MTYAASPREDFESDKLLMSAVAEISALDRDQLEAVIDYIANCNPTPAPGRDFGCERATRVAQIKTSRATSFALLRSSLYVVDKVIQWNRVPTTDRDDKSIDRRVEIFRALSRAASERHETFGARDGRR